ncbi:MAG: hypothetical protein AAB847_02745 [Patescibacteria group bacterium]
MSFLIFILALFPIFNAPSPCAQQSTVIEQLREAKRKIYQRLEIEKKPIVAVNPERIFNSENSARTDIGGVRIFQDKFAMPEGWELLGLSSVDNIQIYGQSYLVAQVQRESDKRILEMILPIILNVQIGDPTNRIYEKRALIVKYISSGVKEYEEKEKLEEIKLAEYQKEEGERQAKVKKQQTEKEKRERILALQKQIDTNDELSKDCFRIAQNLVDDEGIIWEIWNCKNNIIAKPAFESKKKFVFKNQKNQKRNSVIKIIDRNLPEDKDEFKKELLKQIEEVKKATLL